jgi:hypothetical protein
MLGELYPKVRLGQDRLPIEPLTQQQSWVRGKAFRDYYVRAYYLVSGMLRLGLLRSGILRSGKVRGAQPVPTQ